MAVYVFRSYCFKIIDTLYYKIASVSLFRKVQQNTDFINMNSFETQCILLNCVTVTCSNINYCERNNTRNNIKGIDRHTQKTNDWRSRHNSSNCYFFPLFSLYRAGSNRHDLVRIIQQTLEVSEWCEQANSLENYGKDSVLKYSLNIGKKICLIYL